MINAENSFDLSIRRHFPNFRRHVFAFISLFILILIIYGNSLQGAWQFDDLDGIVINTKIHLTTLSWSEIKNTFFSTAQSNLSRPVSNFTFALNYYAGGLNVFGYHLVNIIIHLIASFFLYLLIYHTLNLPLLKDKYKNTSYSIALLAAFLWASSPLHVNAVTYIVQRMTSLAGMAYVMAMYFYLQGRTAQDTSWRIVFFLLCGVAGGMAIGSKENAVMLPIAIFLYDLFLIQGVSAESIRKSRPVFLLILVTAMAGLVYVIFFTTILDYQYWTFSMKERLLTSPRILLFYISLLLYPLSFRLTMDHDIQISRSLIDTWSTLPAILIIVCVIGYALWIARRKPFLSFCILFFFVNHLIEGTIIPLDFIFEHRNYVPAMFFFAPVAILIVTVLDYFAYKRSLQFLMFFVMTFLLVAQGHTVSTRNDIFKYPEVFWRDNIRKYPNLSRPHGLLGLAYAGRGDYPKAIKEMNTALQLANYPNERFLMMTHINLGSVYLMNNNDNMVMSHYNEALRIHSEASESVYGGMALVMLNEGNMKLARKYGQMAIAYAPNDEVSHNSFSLVLLKDGNLDGAIKEATHAIALQPNFIIPLAILGEAYRQKGNYTRSEYYWNELVVKDPNNITAHLALIELYHLQEKKEKLIPAIGKILYLSPEGNIIGMIKKDKNKFFPYIPDPEKLLPILQDAFLQLAHSDATRRIQR